MNNPKTSLQISRQELNNHGLFVATPMYGGQCFGNYTQSIASLSVGCKEIGIPMRSYFMFNESLITRARNYCADEFLRSQKNENGDYFDFLLFIDSDIGFNPQDVIFMMGLMIKNPDYDVLCAPYPKKNISYEKLVAAVNAGVADENPEELSNYVGDFVFNLVDGKNTISLNEPFDVAESGTGFMMIRRQTLLDMMEKYPQYMYKPDHVRTKDFDGSRKIMQFFQAEIDPDSERYLSEDYWFCKKVREMGKSVKLCPWMHLTHTGTFTFSGSVEKILMLGQSLTADPKLLKK